MSDDVTNLSGVLARAWASIPISLLTQLLLGAELLTCVVARAASAQESTAQSELRRQPEARVPLLSRVETWERLPDAEEGGGVELPVWARALANSLPRTTAAMLQLDWLHRAQSPLDPKLRGKMRWTVARANRCDYATAYAAADLLRAGLDGREIQALQGEGSHLPEAERAALTFARKMTLAASTVTDTEVAQLIEIYGDKQVVAMVLLVAFANFQDRLVLALGLPVESGGPLPPVHVRFAKESSINAVSAPSRKQPIESQNHDAPALIDNSEWLAASFATLQSKIEDQRDSQPRIRVPTWEEVREQLPGRPVRDKPLRIKWSLVCLGYQPELANGWSACTRAFREEAQQDRVFEESLFWVITRTIDCFY